jgi:hypothetical protein
MNTSTEDTRHHDLSRQIQVVSTHGSPLKFACAQDGNEIDAIRQAIVRLPLVV